MAARIAARGRESDPWTAAQPTAIAPQELSSVEAPPIVHEALRSAGQPLDPATRAYIEPRLGVNRR
jgi:hypothetical protein